MKTQELPIPGMFQGTKIDEVRGVPYHAVAAEARQWAKQHGIQPAAKDQVKIGLLPIDCQITFSLPGFELYVGGRSGTGAVDDAGRLRDWVLRNVHRITGIDPTFDTHTEMQIFFEDFFVDDQGNHPAPMSMFSQADLKNGTWKVNPAVAAALGVPYMMLQQHVVFYAGELEKRGKYLLTIWPYHAMLGSVGHALVPALEEAFFFHAKARDTKTNREIKGGNPLTENYSILRPEVLTTYNQTAIAQKNSRFIEKLLKYDYLVIAGQAKSHCVAWTIDDLLDEINAQDPALARKVYLLEDCTSPVVVPGVVDFTDEADKAFERFRQAGMHVVRSTDPIEQWPDISL